MKLGNNHFSCNLDYILILGTNGFGTNILGRTDGQKELYMEVGFPPKKDVQ